jgi:membrane fusion protein, heavy metal efflux system
MNPTRMSVIKPFAKLRWVGLVFVLGFGMTSLHAGPGAHGPNGEHLDQAASPGASGLSRLPDGSVNVPKLAQRRMGLRTRIAPESEAAETVQLPGRVIADPNASGLVQSVHGGRIEAGPQGLPVAGQAVRQGEVLAWVQHHAEPYAQAAQQAQRAELRAARELAEQRLKRLESLEGSVPRKDIDASRIEARSLAERERSIGASLVAREALRAPVSGVIARTDLRVGQMVESREVLIEVLDPARMLVEATTPKVELGAQLGNASLVGQEGVQLQLIGAARSLRDGVLPLTFRVRAKPSALLAVGQTVTVIAALQTSRKGIVLPAEAVVRSPAKETVVWIKTGAERYAPQPVRVQPLDARTVLVTHGLAPDNRVVVQGAALVAQIR